MTLTLKDIQPGPVEMEVNHPTLGKLPLKLTVQGTYAASVKQKSLEAIAVLRGALDDSPENLAKKMNKMEDISSETAALAILGWDNDEIMGGKYSPEYAMELMKNPLMGWLREEVNAFVKEQNNFFRQSSL